MSSVKVGLVTAMARMVRRVASPLVEFTPEWRARAVERMAAFERRAVPVPDGHRAAAVAACIVPDDDNRACFVLTRRAVGLKTHARQWAMPGGRFDDGEDAIQAARRELHEEIGLAPSDSCLLGLLDDYQTRSGFVITPVVFWIDDGNEPVANPTEVESIHRFPLENLDHPSNPRLLTIPESDRPVIQLLIATDTLLHAPTAAVLHQLSEVIVHDRPTRVDHFDQPRWAWK
jgi:8-oxo-dGTP pyrophosphatase MutT (NUDIX family)